MLSDWVRVVNVWVFGFEEIINYVEYSLIEQFIECIFGCKHQKQASVALSTQRNGVYIIANTPSMKTSRKKPRTVTAKNVVFDERRFKQSILLGPTVSFSTEFRTWICFVVNECLCQRRHLTFPRYSCSVQGGDCLVNLIIKLCTMLENFLQLRRVGYSFCESPIPSILPNQNIQENKIG